MINSPLLLSQLTAFSSPPVTLSKNPLACEERLSTISVNLSITPSITSCVTGGFESIPGVNIASAAPEVPTGEAPSIPPEKPLFTPNTSP